VSEIDEKRQAIAKKMGFDAYGSTRDMPDPVATAINGMLDHIHVMDERLEDMCKSLKGLGVEISDLRLPDLESCELNHIDDKEIKDTGPSEAALNDADNRDDS
jgi:serine O-acetyltransferase